MKVSMILILQIPLNNELIHLTIRGKSMNLYELNKKITVARQNGYIFIRINKLTVKFFSLLRYRNKSYYLKFRMPLCHRQFLRKNFQNREYLDNFCNDRNKPFHFAFQKWIEQLN